MSGILTTSVGGGRFKLIVLGGNDINLRSLALASGWNGFAPVLALVQGDLGPTGFLPAYSPVGADRAPVMTIDGAWPGGLHLQITAVIRPRGGAGGGTGQDGKDGCTALVVRAPCSVQNDGVIYGGGGGGGGDAASVFNGRGGMGGALWGFAYASVNNSDARMGTNGADGFSLTGGHGRGGKAGYYIDGDSYVTWIKKGTVKGRAK